MRLIYLAVFAALILAGLGKGDEITFNDFSLNIGDSIEIGSYHIELIEIQSIRDGIVVIRASKPGSGLDEQRALLENSANSFDGGSEKGGLTITVVQIFDEQSAKMRVEYSKELGTPRKQTSSRAVSAVNVPILQVQKSFDKQDLSVGDRITVTITVKNVGSGPALDAVVNDQPPLPQFSYVGGYPPKINSKLNPGDSDSDSYFVEAVKEGAVRVPAVEVRYADSKKNARSNTSEPFNVVINPARKPELEVRISSSAPIPFGERGRINVSLTNNGKAPAYRVELKPSARPEGLDVSGLERTYSKLDPGAEEQYFSDLKGERSGNYTITLKASFQSGDEFLQREASAEVVVREREYKYLYYLLILPVIIIAAWIVKRYREFKY